MIGLMVITLRRHAGGKNATRTWAIETARDGFAIREKSVTWWCAAPKPPAPSTTGGPRLIGGTARKKRQSISRRHQPQHLRESTAIGRSRDCADDRDANQQHRRPAEEIQCELADHPQDRLSRRDDGHPHPHAASVSLRQRDARARCGSGADGREAWTRLLYASNLPRYHVNCVPACLRGSRPPGDAPLTYRASYS